MSLLDWNRSHDSRSNFRAIFMCKYYGRVYCIGIRFEFSTWIFRSTSWVEFLGASLLDCYTGQVYAVPITNCVLRVTFVCRVDGSSSLVNFFGLIDGSRLCLAFTGRVYKSRLLVRITNCFVWLELVFQFYDCSLWVRFSWRV